MADKKEQQPAREVLWRDTIADNDIKQSELPEKIKNQITAYENLEKVEPLDESALDAMDEEIDEAIINWYEGEEEETPAQATETPEKKADGGKAAEETAAAPVIPVVEETAEATTESFPTAVKKPAPAAKKEEPKEGTGFLEDMGIL